jgi:hypothetical protein
VRKVAERSAWASAMIRMNNNLFNRRSDSATGSFLARQSLGTR